MNMDFEILYIYFFVLIDQRFIYRGKKYATGGECVVHARREFVYNIFLCLYDKNLVAYKGVSI